MSIGRIFKEIGTEAPVAVAAGFTNYAVANHEKDSLVKVKPAALEWWTAIGMFSVGILGKVFRGLPEVMDEVLEPAAAIGLADATQLGIRLYESRKTTSGGTTTTTSRAQQQRRTQTYNDNYDPWDPAMMGD